MSQFAFVVVTAALLAADPSKAQESIRVECHGQLRTGVVAIGGETTGTTITFHHISWELQLPDDMALEFAKSHDRKPVTVIGSLRQVTGTQIPVRWIVDVEKISARHESEKPGTTLTLTGTLQARDSKDAVKSMMIDTHGIHWPVDLSKDSNLQTRGKELMGKRVVMKGSVEQLAEPRDPVRTFIQVEALDAAKD